MEVNPISKSPLPISIMYVISIRRIVNFFTSLIKSYNAFKNENVEI